MKIDLKNIDFFYINLDKREDKNQYAVQHLTEKGITATRFSALTPEDSYPINLPSAYTPGAKGCFLSHYKLISEYDRESQNILGIFEDDVVLCKDFSERFKYIEENFDQDWDIFFLSSFYHLNSDPKKWHSSGDFDFTGIKYIHRTYASFCTHAYLINPKSIDKILNLMRQYLHKSYAIDHLYILIQPYLNSFSFTPGMANQLTGESDVDGNKNKNQTVFEKILGAHYYSDTLEQFNYNKYFNIPDMNTSNSISNQKSKFIFKNNAFSYIIYNYDYFNTEYRIKENVALPQLPEYSQIMSFINSMTRGKSVVDIGANCGLLSIPCAMSGYKTYAVEPISLNIDLLNLNKEENRCSELEIIPLAFSNVCEKQNIFIPYCSDNTSLNKDIAISNMTNKNYIEETIECSTFDKWHSDLGDNNIGFIKIDVQGFEMNVLQGMKNFISNCNDVFIFLEWDEKLSNIAGFSLSEIHRLLDSNGFRLAKILVGDRLYYKGNQIDLSIFEENKKRK